jgi:ribosomal protein L7/L12
MTKLEELVLEWQEAKRQDYEAIYDADILNAEARLAKAEAALMAYKVPTNGDLPDDVMALARAGDKIGAIMLLRNDHIPGLSLATAKSAVEHALIIDGLRQKAAAVKA